MVVNYRSAELVERCVAAVEASAGGLRLETVVVDNDSADGSVERLRDALEDAEVVAMPRNAGFAAGVNAGFAHCTAEAVLVLNPDTELRGDALPQMLAQLRGDPRIGVLAPLLEDADGRIAPNGYRRFPSLPMLALDMCVACSYALGPFPRLHPYVLSPAELLAGRAPEWVCGAAMLIRREAYEQAGPLDEGFFLYFEETEWQSRVRSRGWEVALHAGARARHLIRGGGELALSPSPHFVTSAIRYLRARGVSETAARVVLAVSLTSSSLTLRAIALLPDRRGRASLRARAYASLARHALRR